MKKEDKIKSILTEEEKQLQIASKGNSEEIKNKGTTPNQDFSLEESYKKRKKLILSFISGAIVLVALLFWFSPKKFNLSTLNFNPKEKQEKLNKNKEEEETLKAIEKEEFKEKEKKELPEKELKKIEEKLRPQLTSVLTLAEAGNFAKAIENLEKLSNTYDLDNSGEIGKELSGIYEDFIVFREIARSGDSFQTIETGVRALPYFNNPDLFVLSNYYLPSQIPMTLAFDEDSLLFTKKGKVEIMSRKTFSSTDDLSEYPMLSTFNYDRKNKGLAPKGFYVYDILTSGKGEEILVAREQSGKLTLIGAYEQKDKKPTLGEKVAFYREEIKEYQENYLEILKEEYGEDYINSQLHELEKRNQ